MKNYLKINKIFIYLLFSLLLSSCTSINLNPIVKTLPYSTLPKSNKKIKIALVLGGGGMKGLAHLGVIETLEKAGIKPDLIVGCSVGAIIGGLYADNQDIKHIKSIMVKTRREQFLKFSSKNLPFGISNNSQLSSLVLDELSIENFEDLKIPFVATATNLANGELTAFASGPLEPAIRASSAYPGVYTPVKINDQYFVDGGVSNPVPVEIAKNLGADYVIAVDISSMLVKESISNLFSVVKRSFEISYMHQSKMAVEKANFVIKIPFEAAGTFDDDTNEENYNLGKNIAETRISELKKSIQLHFVKKQLKVK